MARKNGCPFSIRDWQVDANNPAATRQDPDWVRIKGNNSLDNGFDSDTEDGSSPESSHSENYKTKINGTVSLECRRVIDPVTGERDRGQALLDMYMQMVGCDADGLLRLADPVGNVAVYDINVTGSETSVDDTSETVSWDMDIIGEPEIMPYVQAASVTVLDGDQAVTAISIPRGATKTLTVKIEPENASNQRFGVASYDMTKVKVANIDSLNFDIVGSVVTDTPINVAVTTKNNSLRAVVAVTVTEA